MTRREFEARQAVAAAQVIPTVMERPSAPEGLLAEPVEIEWTVTQVSAQILVELEVPELEVAHQLAGLQAAADYYSVRAGRRASVLRLWLFEALLRVKRTAEVLVDGPH